MRLITPLSAVQTGDGKVYMIAFFAPWCGHCKRLAPTWVEMATKLKDNGNVKVAYIDCTQHRDICSNAGVRTCMHEA